MLLIITNTQDLTADFVVREISRRGLPFARLNTDEFPIHAVAWTTFQADCVPEAVLEWSNRERILDWSTVTAVWYRRPVPPVLAPEVTDPGLRKFCTDESYDFLRGLWYVLKCFWISHPDSIRRAEHKLVQLREAQRCGFLIPRTVVTNCPEKVLELSVGCPTGIVVKPLYVGFLTHGEEEKFVYTTRISEDDLADSQAIRLAPSIYQELVLKVADIRVTVVGTRVFSARIQAPELPPHIPDWRYADHQQLQHSTYELSTAEQQKCIQLVRCLGLEFGAIDYALDQAGRHVFLEINPNGQWAWLETVLGFDISAAIVDHLVAGGRR